MHLLASGWLLLFLPLGGAIILLYLLKVKRRPHIVPSVFLWEKALQDVLRKWNESLGVEVRFAEYDDLFGDAPMTVGGTVGGFGALGNTLTAQSGSTLAPGNGIGSAEWLVIVVRTSSPACAAFMAAVPKFASPLYQWTLIVPASRVCQLKRLSA